jgi:hypothetical protein
LLWLKVVVAVPKAEVAVKAEVEVRQAILTQAVTGQVHPPETSLVVGVVMRHQKENN